MSGSPSPAALMFIIVVVILGLAVLLDRLCDNLLLVNSGSGCDGWLGDGLGLAGDVLAVLTHLYGERPVFDLRIWWWSRLLVCHSRRYSLGLAGRVLAMLTRLTS